MTGRFGPYVQLGEQEDGSKRKPKRASLFASMTPETVTLEQALELLSLPRTVGVDAEGREIVAAPGRFGPYLKRSDGETRSLADEAQLLTVTLAEAEALFAQPKTRRGRQQKPPIAELGPHPESGAAVRVLDGRYGPYVTDGTVNATVPRGVDPAALTLDEAVALLAARAAQAPGRARRASEEDGEEGGEAAGEEARDDRESRRRRPGEGDEARDDRGEGRRSAARGPRRRRRRIPTVRCPRERGGADPRLTGA
ncbi:MAG: hypothetical protein KatS3mg009_0752 [Acidimicrobiia bacterium]|nr:MAG: hypothetical protein KatS3mg009_0752 [Acidimicrobiia bacterium]